MWLRNVGVVMLVMAVGFTAFAGEEKKAKPSSSDTMKSGIEVEGYWKLTVLNPDGTLAQEVAFHNALVNPAILTGFIKGIVAPGGMYVELGNSSSTGGPCGNSVCNISDGVLNIGLTPDATNLTFTDMGTNFETLRLQGNVTVTSAATIDLVRTWLAVCGQLKPSDCKTNPDSLGVFTSKTLSSGVAVTVGQIVQFTVDITFS